MHHVRCSAIRGNLMAQPAATTNLAPLRATPTGRCPQVRPARRYLNATHASVTSLLDTFDLLRGTAATSKGKARGRMSRDQVDVLRASIVFTCRLPPRW